MNVQEAVPIPIDVTLPRWAVTWVAGVAVVVAAKVAIAHGHGRVASAWWGWLGMDPARFHGRQPTPPSRREVLTTWIYIALGIGLLWGVVPRMAAGCGATAIGLLGLGMTLHFGIARLLSIHWRNCGYDAQPLFDRPLASVSLGEFWGRRWNRGFSDAMTLWVYRPLSRRVGSRGASAAVFAVSGVGHDALLSLPAGGGFGRCSAYFAIQLVGLLCQRRWRSRIYTLAVVVLPLPLLFHEPFLERVAQPFLAAIGVLPS